MLPQSLLPQLSPTAAKLYICLLTLTDPQTKIPGASLARAPIATLTQLSALSPRTCKRALAELRALHLLARLPRRYHQPASYLLTTHPPGTATVTERPSRSHLTSTRPAQATPKPSQSKVPPQSPYTPTKSATPDPTPTSPTKHSALRTKDSPTVPPTAPLLNTNPKATHGTAPDLDALLNPTLLKFLLATIPPDQTSQLLATAHSTLTRLNTPAGAAQ